MKKRKPKTAGLTLEWEKYPAYKHIIGLDEAGRGAWAGAVVVGAVSLPLDWGEDKLLIELAGVRDSKEMTRLSRERLVVDIKRIANAWGVGMAESHEVDEIGINPATNLALRRALTNLQEQFPNFKPDYLFTDGLLKGELGFPYDCIVKGDQKSLSIAAASVLAKTHRDEMMVALDKEYPDYRFSQHKGYGTKLHLELIEELGILPVHRRYYRPIKKIADLSPSSPRLN
ncbi:MAG TPA: ribonuclease HII [Aggregatilineales bacterium]|nr:ribonuclease HII [Aggregatilineales bacterium]